MAVEGATQRVVALALRRGVAEISSVSVWRALLLVYRQLDVSISTGRWRSQRFRHTATDREVVDALQSFRAFPDLATNLTGGAVRMVHEIVHVDRSLTSLSAESPERWWPSPTDTRRELDEFAPRGQFDSVFIFWPQRDFIAGTAVPCDAWGLAVGASDWSNGATYAAIANAPTAAWRGEAPGEVWLHEWLHGVCHHFVAHGHAMPDRDADGAELHGYVRSPTCGWTDYYRDLMTGNVVENNRRVGIPIAAWSDQKTLPA